MTAPGSASQGDGAPRDGDLLDAIVRGDLAALDALYRRHASLAYGLALRMTGDKTLAADAVQSAFMSIWSDRHTHDGGTDPLRIRLVQLIARASLDQVRRGLLSSELGSQPRGSLAREQRFPVVAQGS